MKRLFLIWLAASAALCACSKEDSDSTPDTSSKLKFKVGIVQLSSEGTASVPSIAWAENDRIAILPVAAKAEPSVEKGLAVPFVSAGAGASVFFTSTSTDFYPDESIPRHKFAVAYPYLERFSSDGSGIVPSAAQTVSAPGVISKESMSFFGYVEISGPTSGSIVIVRMNPTCAVAGIPVPADFESVKGIVLKSGSATLVSLNVVSDQNHSARHFYVGIPSGSYTSLSAELSSSKGETRTVVLGDLNAVAGRVYNLTDVTPAKKVCYSIDLSSLDFGASFIYDAQTPEGETVAVVCKEYLDTTSNQQAITVYGTKPGSSHRIMDSADPVCLVAKVLMSAPRSSYSGYAEPQGNVHGGVFSFATDNVGYLTEGTSAPVETAYAVIDAASGVSSITASAPEEYVPAKLVPRTLVFTDRSDPTGYKLVKMGRQIWTAENLGITKFNDGSEIPSKKAAELYPYEGPAYVNTASTTMRNLYNVAAVKDAKFLPENSAWKVPTSGDIKNLVARIPESGMITEFDGASNITLFSVLYKGRVTNKGWTSDTKVMDPCYWSQTASTVSGNEAIHTQCMVVRAANDSAPALVSGQNNHFGFYVRLVRGLY